MKTVKKGILLLLCTAFMLSGCSGTEVADYKLPSSYSAADSGIVDQNENYELIWDEDDCCVLYKNKNNGVVWSTTPYEYYQTGETGYSLSSPVVIDYYDPEDNSVQTEKSYECFESGTISSKIKNKTIYVTYYFEYPEINVTVSYQLKSNALKVALNSNDLSESGKTKLISVSLAPFLCSLPNSENKDSYLFIPTGSGALMYTDEETGDVIREYSGEVYGNDPAKTELDNPADQESIRMPCFGVSDGSKGLFAVIESGDGAAHINASAGSADRGYSNVYASFDVRGYNNIEWSMGDYHGTAIANDVVMLNDIIPSDREYSVLYYPLSGDEADYNGMAARYRKYLQENNLLQKSESVQQNYRLTILGGALVKKFFLGVPYSSLLPITDFSQAKEMCECLTEKTGKTPLVLLKGFGESGINAGEIGGGFNFSSKFEKDITQKEFEKFCKENQISLFTDFDLIQFTKSGNGFSTFLDTAKTANDQTVAYFPKKKNIRTDDETAQKIKFLKRAEISKATDKMLSFCEDKVSGISLESFASFGYSDYSDVEYMLKANLTSQAEKIIGSVKKSGHSVLLNSANAYAAGISDGIADVPLENGKYNAFDEEIPFYEMVFKGSVPLYSKSLNLTVNSRDMLLNAVAVGVSPSFTLGYEIDKALLDNSYSEFYGIKYSDNITLIEDVVKETEKFFDSVGNSEIKNHRIIDDGITKTEFSNGVTVYVNRSDKDYNTNEISVPAKSFVY